MNKKLFLSVALGLNFFIPNIAATYVSNGFFEESTEGWAMWNGESDGAVMERNTGTQFDGQGCLKIVNPLNEPEKQWKVQIHTSFSSALPAGDYELSYYIKTLSGTGSVRVSIAGEEKYQADQEVTSSYNKIVFPFTANEDGGVTGFNFDIAHTSNTYFIDNVVLTPINVNGEIPNSGETTEATVTVDISKTYQTVEGIGGGLVYYQGWAVSHKNSAAIFDTLFNGLTPSAIRLGNWLQNLDDGMDDDIAVQEEAVKRLGRENYIIEMSSWAAPGKLKSNGGINGGYPLKKSNGRFVYDEYAEWWKQSLKKYMDNGIVPEYISMQNEPDMKAEYAATIFDPCENYVDYTGTQFDNSGYAEALPVFCSKIKELPNAPKILGPEVLGIGYNNTQNYMSKLDKSLLDGLAFHYYHSGENASDRYSEPDRYLAAQKKLAKDFADMPQFMTENCAMRSEIAGDAVHTAWIIANGFNANNLNGYFHWNLVWGDADGCITVFNPWSEGSWKNADGFTVNEEYHGLRHFTKFVQRGWKRTDYSSDNSDLVCSAFVSPDGKQSALIVINKGKNAHSVLVSSPFSNGKAYLTQTCCSAGERSVDKGETDLSERIEMKGMSISTITFVADDKSSLNTTTADNNIIANMANNELTISTSIVGSGNLEMWDATGRILLNKSVRLDGGEQKFTVNGIYGGLYFVKITVDNGTKLVTKVIVK